MNGLTFSLHLLKGSPCGGTRHASAGWSEVALWGKWNTPPFSYVDQVAGATLAEGFLKAHLSSKFRKEGGQLPLRAK